MRSERKRGELNVAAHRIFNAVCVLRTWEDFVERSFLATSVVMPYVRTVPWLVPWSDRRSKIPQEISISGISCTTTAGGTTTTFPTLLLLCIFRGGIPTRALDAAHTYSSVSPSPPPPPCVHCLDPKAKHQFLLFSPTCGLFFPTAEGDS